MPSLVIRAGSAAGIFPEPNSGFSPQPGFELTGTLNHGEEITVTGAGFGTKSQAAPVLWDFGDEVYENGVLNSRHAGVSVGSSVPDGSEASGDIYTSVSGVVFSTASLRHSRLGRHYAGTGTGDNAFLKHPYCTMDGAATSSPTEQWYLSWRQKFNQRVARSTSDAAANGGAYMGSLKTLRWGSQDGFRCVNRINASPTFFWAWLDGASEVRAEEDDPHNEISLYPALNGGQKWYLSEFKTWRRGDGLMGGSEFWDFIYGSQWDVTNQQASMTNSMSWTIEELGMDATVSGGIIPYFGEVYFDNSTKRIAIGDSNVWSSCTADGTELQRPTSWGNSQLRFALNLGSFSSLAGKYLYWVQTNSSGVDQGTLIGQFT